MSTKQVMHDNDNRYDKPFRYSRKNKAYLVTMQHQTMSLPSIIEVTPEHGDRAVAKGRVEKFFGCVDFYAFRYYMTNKPIYIRKFQTFDEAIQAILNS